MTIAWRDVGGFEGLYQLSSVGTVRSLARTKLNRWGGRMLVPPRELKLDYSDRYARCFLCKDGTRHRVTVHTLVLETFVGPRPDGTDARHLDGDTRNNAATNLAWGTRIENAADKYRHGTQRFGTKLHNHVLDPAKVKTIRDLGGRLKLREIGEIVGCHTSTVHHVLSGRTWSDN